MRKLVGGKSLVPFWEEDGGRILQREQYLAQLSQMFIRNRRVRVSTNK